MLLFKLLYHYDKAVLSLFENNEPHWGAAHE